MAGQHHTACETAHVGSQSTPGSFRAPPPEEMVITYIFPSLSHSLLLSCLTTLLFLRYVSHIPSCPLEAKSIYTTARPFIPSAAPAIALSLSLRRAWPSLICVGPWAHDGEAIFDADGGMSTAQHERERKWASTFLLFGSSSFLIISPPLDSCSLRPALVTAGPDGIFLVKKGLAKRFVPSSQPIGSFGSLSLQRETQRETGQIKYPGLSLLSFPPVRPFLSFLVLKKKEICLLYILRSISIYSLKGRAPFLVLVSSLFF